MEKRLYQPHKLDTAAKQQPVLWYWIILGLAVTIVVFLCSIVLASKEAQAKSPVHDVVGAPPGKAAEPARSAPVADNSRAGGGSPRGADKPADSAPLANGPVRTANSEKPPSTEPAGGTLGGDSRTAGQTLEESVKLAAANTKPLGEANEESAGLSRTRPAPLADRVGKTVGEVDETAAPMIKPVLDRARSTSTIEPATETAQSVVNPASKRAAPMLDPVEEVTSPMLTPLSKTVAPMFKPVAEAMKPMLGPVVDISDPIKDPILLVPQEDLALRGPPNEAAAPTPAGDTTLEFKLLAARSVLPEDYVPPLLQPREVPLPRMVALAVLNKAYALSAPAISSQQVLEETNGSLASGSAIGAKEENPKGSSSASTPATAGRPSPYGVQFDTALAGGLPVTLASVTSEDASNRVPTPFSLGVVPAGSASTGSGSGTAAGLGLGVLALLFVFLVPNCRFLCSIREFAEPSSILLPLIEQPG